MADGSSLTLVQADAARMAAALPALTELLQDAVAHGASVGFLQPLQSEAAASYWQGVQAQIAAGEKLLWLAFDGAKLAGTVQLEPCGKENGKQRGEVQKLLVRSDLRRLGVAAQLMQALQRKSLDLKLRLLFLDTETGSGAEAFYQRIGFTRVGDIPDYCLAADGKNSATTIYYKQLTEALA